MKLKFGSVCSGIEAASVAWEPLGWKASWFAEIEPFPSEVLSYRFPETMNLGDMTKIAEMVEMGFVEDPDILVGGTPCQAFSVAGSRQSLGDERGQLSLSFITLANTIDEQRIENGKDESIVVWENVPGVLNTKDNAFGCFLGELSGAGCELQPAGKKWSNSGCVFGPKRAIAWRILDAQYFGVAQRRRRVFVVASARKGFNPAEILFESEGVRRDIAPSRSAGQETTGSTGSGIKNPSGYRMTAFGQYADDETASTMKQRDYKDATDLVVAVNDNQTFGIPGNWIGRKPENGGNAVEPMINIAPCQTKTDRHAVAYALADHATPKHNEEICFTLNRRDFKGAPCVNTPLVRRLTPVECERLQGFPDNWTKIPYRGKPTDQCPDGPRYAACGNSMAVPVMMWIGQRIEKHLKDLELLELLN